jgi:hypothetical protein
MLKKLCHNGANIFLITLAFTHLYIHRLQRTIIENIYVYS